MKLFTTTVFLLFLTNQSAQAQWQFYRVDDGVKPALALDSSDIAHITYMLEDHDGYIRHAIWNTATAAFDISLVSSGYFYGPLDVVLDPNNIPHINYHDHSFADQVHAYLSGDGWTLERIEHNGHDGWDNAIVIDPNGYPHTSTVDPAGFDGDGVEYAYFDGAQWNVESLGSGPVMYAFSTSLALDQQNRAHLTFHDDINGALLYAVRQAPDQWQITNIDEVGDTGLFASLALDASDTPHISYFRYLGDNQGEVKYARWNGSSWTIQTIDRLNHVTLGFSGARNLTSLVIDSDGAPHVAYGDEQVIKHARLAGTTWIVEPVLDVSGSATLLGQLVSLDLDAQNNPHIAYYEATQLSPLTGVVHYAAKRSTPTSVEKPAVPAGITHLEHYPNPVRSTTTIRYSLPTPSHVKLQVYDVLGREVAILVNAYQNAQAHEILFDTQHRPDGLYFYRLWVDGVSTESRLMLVVR